MPATAAAAPSPNAAAPSRARFAGSAREYFRLWIVDVLLSAATLGLWSAWATVRARRWFAARTVLDGAAFGYHATGSRVLAGRLVAAASIPALAVGATLHPLLPLALGALLVLALPWALRRSARFELRMTSWRGARFDFVGSLGGMYLWTLAVPLSPLAVGAALAALCHFAGAGPAWTGAAAGTGTVGTIALSPWVHVRLAAYTFDGCRHGGAPLSVRPCPARLRALYAEASVLGLVAGTVLAIVAGTAAVLVAGVSEASLAGLRTGRDVPASALMLAAVAACPATALGSLILSARFQARLRAHLSGGAGLDGCAGVAPAAGAWELVRADLSGLLVRVATLGLGAPWARVRSARLAAARAAGRAATLGA